MFSLLVDLLIIPIVLTDLVYYEGHKRHSKTPRQCFEMRWLCFIFLVLFICAHQAVSSSDGTLRVYEAPDVMNLGQWTLQHTIASKLSCSSISWNPSMYDIGRGGGGGISCLGKWRGGGIEGIIQWGKVLLMLLCSGYGICRI